MARVPHPDIAKFYSSPASKRGMARAIAVVSAVMLVWLVVSGLRNWQMRADEGIPPNYGAAFLWIAPLLLLGVGLWIGWGHVRVDLKRLTVQRRPIGLPFPATTWLLSEARRLYVGFDRGPFGVQVADPQLREAAPTYWYVHLQGPAFDIPLVVQRERKQEALAFAEHIGDVAGLPVVVSSDPRSGARAPDPGL